MCGVSVWCVWCECVCDGVCVLCECVCVVCVCGVSVCGGGVCVWYMCVCYVCVLCWMKVKWVLCTHVFVGSGVTRLWSQEFIRIQMCGACNLHL